MILSTSDSDNWGTGTDPAVVGDGGGVVVAESAHITEHVATPLESFLSDKNINLMGFVLSTSGAFVLQKNCFPTFNLSPFLHFGGPDLLGRSNVVHENLIFLHLVFPFFCGL